MDAGALIRSVRSERGLTQAQLARRAETSQPQIGRIERGEISPGIDTVDRVLASMGKRLELRAEPLGHGNVSVEELRHDYATLDPGERIAQAAELSNALTSIAAAGR
ncbi:MAG: helix-turn-helix transcriptional regulator [Thermoleophilaceae bacterium]|nr:helix-turn-helix transcriptional regulator [Thermoleophilaceae bacterium]